MTLQIIGPKCPEDIISALHELTLNNAVVAPQNYARVSC
jgi:hypothetical protein